MSRVDEALRRAAGQTTGGERSAANPISDFPLDPAQAATEGPALSSTQVPPRPRTIERATKLLDCIDPRLAEKVVVDAHMSAASREQYRHLAAVLHDAQAASGIKVVMIASAVAGEGKTLTASNLAMTFSESYRKRVLLIDADLRRPTLHQVFKVAAASGLSEGLTGNEPAKLIVRQITPSLSLLPAGRPNADPIECLTSERMRHVVREARESFDWVIIDTPPLVLLSDAHLLAPIADGVVMVVRAKSTPYDLAKRAVDAVGGRLLGVVLNAADERAAPGYYQYGDYRSYSSQPLEATGQ